MENPMSASLFRSLMLIALLPLGFAACGPEVDDDILRVCDSRAPRGSDAHFDCVSDFESGAEVLPQGNPWDVAPWDSQAQGTQPWDVAPWDVQAQGTQPWDAAPWDVQAQGTQPWDVAPWDVQARKAQPWDVAPWDVRAQGLQPWD
jgi:hypothetical protein